MICITLPLTVVSGASVIETPLGNMRVDSNLRDQLLSTNKFAVMERDVDEKEHSGEMQYPYIAKIISDAKEEMGDGEGRRFDGVKVLPIMVGSIRKSKEEAFGRLLAPYLSDSGIFTVISSDFCHCKSFASSGCALFVGAANLCTRPACAVVLSFRGEAFQLHATTVKVGREHQRDIRIHRVPG